MNGIVTVCVRLLEFLFFVGAAGSLVVVLISGVEDLETIFQKDDAPDTPVGGDHNLR